MPIYEYVCEVCGSHFEVRQGFGESPDVACPAGHRWVHRLFSPPTIIFKGSGFYVTDNRKGGPGNGHGSGATEKKQEKKEKAAAD